MKVFIRVITVLLCLFSAVVTLIYMNEKKSEPSSAPTEQELPSLDDLNSLSVAEMMYFEKSVRRMAPGEKLMLQPVMRPEGCIEQIVWSSLNESVAVVDEDGSVTAVASGRTVITAACRLCSASMEIVVGGDVAEDTRLVINTLAADGGNYLEASQLYEQLAEDENEQTAVLRELLGSILDYASGKGDAQRLRAAIEASGFSERECLTAAAVCYAKYEEIHHEAVFSFTGDVTLARYNESAARGRFPSLYAASGSYTYPFDRVRGIFTCDSLTMVNFEGTLTGSTAHRDKSFYFRGDPLYAGILPASSIEAATLANNHSGDYYDRGFDDTVSYLNGADVSVCYEGKTVEAYINGSGGGIGVVMIGICCIGDTIPQADLDALLAEIRSRKSSDNIVVVNFHWGVEGEAVPERVQQSAAHAIIDAGADLIVGHHPHVLQGIEKYMGKYIAYSLGNFAFGGNGTVNNPQTAVLRAFVGRESGGLTVTGISVVPCYTTSSGSSDNNYQPCMRFGESGREVVDYILRRSSGLEYGIKELAWSGI